MSVIIKIQKVSNDLESAIKPRTPSSILRQNIAKLEFLKIAILYICFPVLATFTYFLLGFNLISDFRDTTISDATNGTRYHATNATDGVSYHASDEASYNATSASNYHTMDGANYNTTGGTSYNATDGTGYHAMDNLNYNATDGVNYNAMDGTTYNATDDTSFYPLDVASYHAADIASYHVKDGASYNNMDVISYSATDDVNYHAKASASYHAKDGTSYNATDETSYNAMVDTICEAMPSIVHDTSVLCGIAVFITNWLPSFFCKVYLGTNVRSNGLLLFLFVALFPIVPTVLYIHLLCQRKSTEEDRETYKSLKKTAHEMRSTAEAIQSSTLLIIVICLMHQGILATPWNHPIVSFQDHYRNIAYLPSLSVASIAFPTICILRTLIYLNHTTQSTESKNQLNENAETNQVGY